MTKLHRYVWKVQHRRFVSDEWQDGKIPNSIYIVDPTLDYAPSKLNEFYIRDGATPFQMKPLE